MTLYNREELISKIKEIIKNHPEFNYSNIANELGVKPWVIQDIISKDQSITYQRKNSSPKKLIHGIKCLLEDNPEIRSSELSKILGISESRVLSIMRNHKLPYKYFGIKGTQRTINISDPKIVDKIKHYVYETNLTQDEIGDIFGVSGCTIGSIIQKLKFNDLNVAGRKINWFKPGLKEEIQSLIDKGYSILQMESELGITHCSISKGIKILGLNYKSLKPEVTVWTDNMIKQLTEYINSKDYDILEISRKMGLTRYVIDSEIKRLGLHYDIKEVHQKKYDGYFDLYFNKEMPIEEISNITGAAYNTIYRVLLKEFKKRGLDERLGKSKGERR